MSRYDRIYSRRADGGRRFAAILIPIAGTVGASSRGGCPAVLFVLSRREVMPSVEWDSISTAISSDSHVTRRRHVRAFAPLVLDGAMVRSRAAVLLSLTVSRSVKGRTPRRDGPGCRRKCKARNLAGTICARMSRCRAGHERYGQRNVATDRIHHPTDAAAERHFLESVLFLACRRHANLSLSFQGA